MGIGNREWGIEADPNPSRLESRFPIPDSLFDFPEHKPKDPTAMLKMTHLSKVYRTHMIETHALRGFDIHVREGEFVAVTGPSGSGKTTFLNIAGLLEEFTGGEYFLDGVDVRGMNDDQRSRLRNEKLGFIFQGFNLIPDLNLFDNVDVPLRYRGFNAAERKRRIDDALQRVGLASRMKHFPAELSGGQQQRVAIARALAGTPRLLLADEPTGNLDSQMARGVMELLEEINEQGTTILMVTHDPELAARAQRNVHIIDGQVSDLLRETAASLAAVGINANANA
jgi:putative ABC transport system ATP-binding protein